MQEQSGKIALISCAVFEEDLRSFIDQYSHISHVEYLEMALHLDPPRLLVQLQSKIDELEADPELSDVILLYGLCGMGVSGLHAKRVRLIIPKVHDCISLFLGDRDKYQKLMKENHGRYWYTRGWNREKLVPGPERYKQMFDELMEKFDDEEDVEFIIETDKEGLGYVNTASYVTFDSEDDEREAEYTRKCASYMGWKFDKITGRQDYVKDLLSGKWDDERFLIVPPGHKITASNDSRVLTCRLCRKY